MSADDEVSSRSPTAPGGEWIHPLNAAERLESGKRKRERFPWERLAELTVRDRDPLGIVDRQNVTRLQHLVPLRAERMSQSPFAFYRGTAAIMAADLAGDEHSGLIVPSCGDAHLANFGFYASPQRTLVFDLNDFDEAAWAPWEWDLKRLVTSIVIGARATSRDDALVRGAVLRAVRSYAFALRAAVRRSPTERYFAHFDPEAGVDGLDAQSRDVLRTAIKQSRKRTGERAARKLTRRGDDGRLRFIEQPPTMTAAGPELEERARRYLSSYVESANADVQQLMQNYVIADVMRRVVGVGSVGTRCTLTLLQDGDGHALLMQSKEAARSVLEEYGGIPQPPVLREHVARSGEGARVVGLQRVLQAVSDPFLGYLQADGIDLYVRQFHDMKGGIDVEELEDAPFASYAQACAVTLARAHSQSPTAAVISGYIGKGRAVGEAMLEWAYAYADLSQRDFEQFTARRAAELVQ